MRGRVFAVGLLLAIGLNAAIAPANAQDMLRHVDLIRGDERGGARPRRDRGDDCRTGDGSRARSSWANGSTGSISVGLDLHGADLTRAKLSTGPSSRVPICAAPRSTSPGRSAPTSQRRICAMRTPLVSETQLIRASRRRQRYGRQGRGQPRRLEPGARRPHGRSNAGDMKNRVDRTDAHGPRCGILDQATLAGAISSARTWEFAKLKGADLAGANLTMAQARRRRPHR